MFFFYFPFTLLSFSFLLPFFAAVATSDKSDSIAHFMHLCVRVYVCVRVCVCWIIRLFLSVHAIYITVIQLVFTVGYCAKCDGFFFFPIFRVFAARKIF